MWCMICATKGAKSLAILDAVRCGNVQFHATLQARTTLTDLYGVQGVAGSNPAVPITYEVAVLLSTHGVLLSLPCVARRTARS